MITHLPEVRPWIGKRTYPSFRPGNLRHDCAQGRANGIVGIGVVRMRRRTFSVEMGPLFHSSSPFDIGFANKFFQAMVGGENLFAVARQGKERPIEVVEQQHASLKLTVQQRLQCSRRIREVVS